MGLSAVFTGDAMKDSALYGGSCRGTGVRMLCFRQRVKKRWVNTLSRQIDSNTSVKIGNTDWKISPM